MSMEAKRFLQRIEKINVLIRNKTIEKQLYNDTISVATTKWGGERVQSTPDPHRIETNYISCIDYKKEIDNSIEALKAELKGIMETIEGLPVAQYDILHRVYVQKLSFKEISFECKKSESWAATIHGRALKNLQKILDEREVKEA